MHLDYITGHVSVEHIIDNTGRCYLGMARALQCTRQMSGQLPSILSQLQSHTVKNQLHHLHLWSLLSQQL